MVRTLVLTLLLLSTTSALADDSVQLLGFAAPSAALGIAPTATPVVPRVAPAATSAPAPAAIPATMHPEGPAAAPAQARASSRATARPLVDLGMAINSPLGWARSSFGLSVYAGIGRHFAVRGNLATYEYDDGLHSEDNYRSGQIFDLGLGVIGYLNRQWQGPMVELGVLSRERDVRDLEDTTIAVDHILTDSRILALRTLMGWSWLIGERVFLSCAVGASIGHEDGEETLVPFYSTDPRIKRAVSRTRREAEGYFRIGLRFGK